MTLQMGNNGQVKSLKVVDLTTHSLGQLGCILKLGFQDRTENKYSFQFELTIEQIRSLREQIRNVLIE